MKPLLAALFAMLLPATLHASEITSAYTNLDIDKGCKTLDKAEEGEGSWINLDCPGYRDYRVFVFEDDLRQSISYGPDIEQSAWESFGAFNHAGPKIEWRLEDGRPFAAIHRWFVAAADGKQETQVLVVEKVGQPDAPGGCATALVLASGNAGANDQARKAADEKARGFTCGKDTAERIGKIPDFGREMY